MFLRLGELCNRTRDPGTQARLAPGTIPDF